MWSMSERDHVFFELILFSEASLRLRESWRNTGEAGNQNGIRLRWLTDSD